MTFTTLKEAESIVGKLSKPSKMPGYAYGIPAKECKIGAALVKLKGSVCSSCYALKGRYVFPNVQAAQYKRFNSLKHPRWVEAMAYMIKKRDCEYFRWHDSGDIQGLWHLQNIVDVALACPGTKFWLPTREAGVVRVFTEIQRGTVPPNLVVRISATMVDRAAIPYPTTSTVVTDGKHSCPAYRQGGVCGSCRDCWSPAISNISYPKH